MGRWKNTVNYLLITSGVVLSKIFHISEEPWISAKARDWLDSFLKPNMIVFEYGSGGSTLFFARRVKKVISVEYQLLWYLGVIFSLWRRGILNFKLHLFRPETGKYLDKNYMSSDPNLNSFSFKKFVSTVDQYPDHCFDLIFIDGRARNDCIKHAIPKVKKDGYILLDDSKREAYRVGKNYMSRYKQTKLDKATVWKIK